MQSAFDSRQTRSSCTLFAGAFIRRRKGRYVSEMGFHDYRPCMLFVMYVYYSCYFFGSNTNLRTHDKYAYKLKLSNYDTAANRVREIIYAWKVESSLTFQKVVKNEHLFYFVSKSEIGGQSVTTAVQRGTLIVCAIHCLHVIRYFYNFIIIFYFCGSLHNSQKHEKVFYTIQILIVIHSLLYFFFFYDICVILIKTLLFRCFSIRFL